MCRGRPENANSRREGRGAHCVKGTVLRAAALLAAATCGLPLFRSGKKRRRGQGTRPKHDWFFAECRNGRSRAGLGCGFLLSSNALGGSRRRRCREKEGCVRSYEQRMIMVTKGKAEAFPFSVDQVRAGEGVPCLFIHSSRYHTATNPYRLPAHTVLWRPARQVYARWCGRRWRWRRLKLRV